MLICATIFAGVNYSIMKKSFDDYIAECRKAVKKNIVNLMEST